MTLTSQYEPGIAVLSNLSNDIYWLKNVTKIEGYYVILIP